MRPARLIPPAIRTRSNRTHLVLAAKPAPAETEAGRPVLHCLPPNAARGKTLQFENFDEAYVAQLRAGDPRTEQHFVAYFTALIQIKLRSRLNSREAIEDTRQETFSRFFTALRAGKIQQPDRLGAFVNSMCNRVLWEHYRIGARNTPLDEDAEREFPAPESHPLDALSSQEREKQVREVLDKLSERDRRLLREVFLEEKDKDDVCREFNVNREYLRVLLHRAKESFKVFYLKKGLEPPEFAA